MNQITNIKKKILVKAKSKKVLLKTNKISLKEKNLIN